ncbi:MAG: hypothetical protein CMK00_04735 [Planctomycetes bacterium]|nr:hypothetical protein [Planctomycetota bacterium]
MQVALVTTGAGLRSGIGDYTRHLLPHLARECELSTFVPRDQLPAGTSGNSPRPLGELRPREHDHILYQLGNERGHAFMLPLIRSWGGTVVLHDWVLFDLALAAFPGLARGGVKGHLLALREGGLRQGQVYLRNRRAQRQVRRSLGVGSGAGESRSGASAFAEGWHGPEDGGRWSGPCATLRLPPDAQRLSLWVAATAGRSLRVSGPQGALAEFTRRELAARGEVFVELPGGGSGLVFLETTSSRPTAAQSREGDTRLLGTFFTRVSHARAGEEQVLDLASPAPQVAGDHPLVLDRFSLPLNRSVVRQADSFIVHSEHVAQLVRAERNAMTPLSVVTHGAAAAHGAESSGSRHEEQSRQAARRGLALDEDWSSSTLLVSFGALQKHKRIDKLLDAMAKGREAGADLRLVLAGAPQGDELDVEAMIAAAGLGPMVRITGYLAEDQIARWIDAADICVNLRGPSTGGTSGGLHRCLGRGRLVLASDLNEQGELPGSCVIKVAPGPEEVGELARVMVELARDPDRRGRHEAAARRYVEECCRWPLVARRYAESLAAFPHPRARRVSLIKSAVEAADAGS